MKPSIPERILQLQPYKPGRPIEEVERELGLSGTIKLASNENALGPSPAAKKALAEAIGDLHRYPDGGAVVLIERLAEKLGVDADRIVVGNGSNEILELLSRMFAGPGDEAVMSEDAFLVYRLVVHASGGDAVRVPARGFAHDLAAIGDAVGEKTRLVFLANPNNPTGTIFRRAEWDEFLARVPEHVVVALDQAYFEYVDDPDYPGGLDDLERHPGLVVIRTFSKVYGIAGLRIGYSVSSAEIADAMSRFRQPFNVNSLAQVAALAALDDRAHLDASRGLVREGRRRYAERLAALGLEQVPSQANFVLVEVGQGAKVTQAMLERGVIVRPMDGYGFPSMIRITFGTAEEDERCLAALAEALAEVGP